MAPSRGLLGLLLGLLLAGCTPLPRALSPARQAHVAALADRLVPLPVDSETGAPGAAALLAAWWDRITALAPSVSRSPRGAPSASEEVSNVP